MGRQAAHIRLETEMHLVAYSLGISNAIQVDLDVDETNWSLMKKGVKYLIIKVFG